jgi:hypothetical protein
LLGLDAVVLGLLAAVAILYFLRFHDLIVSVNGLLTGLAGALSGLIPALGL